MRCGRGGAASAGIRRRPTLALLLELDTQGGQFLLDGPRRALPLFEPLALGGGELLLGRGLGGARFRLGEARGELLLALGDPRRLALELGHTGLQLLLSSLERLRALERGALPRDERLGCPSSPSLCFEGLDFPSRRSSFASSRSRSATASARSRSDCFSCSSSSSGFARPLRCFLRQLPREPKQCLAVQVDPGVVGRPFAAGAASTSRTRLPSGRSSDHETYLAGRRRSWRAR